MMVEDFIAVVGGDKSRDNFTSQLFRLIFKSDFGNLAKIRLAFPEEVELFQWWRGEQKNPTADQIRTAYREMSGHREPEGGQVQAVGATAPSKELPF